MELEDLLDSHFPAPDEAARADAAARQTQLTKPPGSLGRLEQLVLDLAAWQGRPRPEARPAAALLFASDHPVARLGVAPYPSEATAAMVQNFLAGGAAASVLARSLGVPLQVVDVGVETPYAPGLREAPFGVQLTRTPQRGRVGDLVEADGLSSEALEGALRAGQAAVDGLSPATRVILLGEMGIGNTTVASALAAALVGGDPDEWVGPGTGAEGEVLERKRRTVEAAVKRVGSASPGNVLRRLGGREVAALVAAGARAASRGMAILVDGFIVSVAMLILVRLRPTVRPALVFAHRSSEPGHRRILELLEARPLLELDLRLGEGSGALTALPLLDTACALHRDMATFAEAGVPDRA